MAGEWRTSTWGEEISLEYGRALRGYDEAVGRYRVFGSNGSIGWTSEPLAPGPGVILGRKGAYRGVHYSSDPFFVIDTAYYVVPKNEFDMRWLFYAIKHYKLGEVDDGSPIPSTTRAAVYVLDLEVPPVDEQRAIAHILGTIDDKIELNRRMNETLEAIAWALFKSWFVDFEPVRAKAEGRAPYLAADLWALFPNALDADEKPMDWQYGVLLDLCELKRGYDLPSGQRTPGPHPIVSSSGISGYHTEPKVQAPGVVTGRYGTIGRVFFINAAYWPLNTALYVCNFKGNSPRYIYHALRQVDFLQFSDKAAVPGINRNHLHKTPVVLPPRPMQQAFERLLEPIWARQEANKAEIVTLDTIRDALLPRLVSGELRVKDTSRVVKAAL